jgi:hypothetical protein
MDAGIINCLPDSPCRNFTFQNVHTDALVPFVCSNLYGTAVNVTPTMAACLNPSLKLLKNH